MIYVSCASLVGLETDLQAQFLSTALFCLEQSLYSVYAQKYWFDKGIVLVSHLLNAQGYLMTYEELLVHFNFPVTPKELSLVLSYSEM